MIGTVIAIISLGFSLYLFIRFDARIKEQERILNDYKIKEYQEAERDKLYAHLSMRTYWRDKDTLYLVIENEGPSDAYNVSVKDLSKDSYLFQDLASSFPISTIDAGDSIQLELLVYSDMPEKARLQVLWEDDSKEKHTDKVILDIY